MDSRPDPEFEDAASMSEEEDQELVLAEGETLGAPEETPEGGGGGESRVYLPGDSIAQDEVLVMDRTAYQVHAEFTGEWPSLSLDVVPDDLGSQRGSTYPLTTYFVAGTQAGQSHQNKLNLIKVSNIKRIKQPGPDGELDESESESESEDEAGDGGAGGAGAGGGRKAPQLTYQGVNHRGGVNRVKVAPQEGCVVASWSDTGRVHIWDMSAQARQLQTRESQKCPSKPAHTFSGHSCEGFALAWSPVVPFRLASGDCASNIHVWNRHEGGAWAVNKEPCSGHTDSVEDISWSPNEPHVFISCGADRTVRVWDVRSAQRCAVTVTAHDCDVNVVSWNKREQHLLASGADDGSFKIWDLRTFMSAAGGAGAGGSRQPEPVATFKWHAGPVTSLEWHPADASVLAVSGADDQISIWDLAVEEDPEAAQAQQGDVTGMPATVPPQLLFVHQGQRNIKEVKWHPQIPGLLLSTAESGFNIFRPISV
eukprot:UC1_evm6s1936